MTPTSQRDHQSSRRRLTLVHTPSNGISSRCAIDYDDSSDSELPYKYSFTSLPQKQLLCEKPPPQDPGRRASFPKASSLKVSNLLKFPPEIQAMIYREYFTSISGGEPDYVSQPPNLLEAVRCQPDIYLKVLEVYRQEYAFLLCAKNEVSFHNNASTDLIRSIRHLTIEELETTRASGWSRDSYRQRSYSSFDEFLNNVWYRRYHAKLHQATQLRSVTIHLRLQYTRSEFPLIADLMFDFFPLLGILSIHFVQVAFFRAREDFSLQHEIDNFENQVELTRLVRQEKLSAGEKQETGLECRWLGKDGKERRLIVEKTLKDD